MDATWYKQAPVCPWKATVFFIRVDLMIPKIVTNSNSTHKKMTHGKLGTFPICGNVPNNENISFLSGTINY
jgi:hypothetical protein